MSVGYGGGLSRAAAKLFRPSVNGVRVPLIGRVCMDRCMLDLTDMTDAGLTVRVGDIAELIRETVSVREMADAEGTVPYEILCRVGGLNKIYG